MKYVSLNEQEEQKHSLYFILLTYRGHVVIYESFSCTTKYIALLYDKKKIEDFNKTVGFILKPKLKLKVKIKQLDLLFEFS